VGVSDLVGPTVDEELQRRLFVAVEFSLAAHGESVSKLLLESGASSVDPMFDTVNGRLGGPNPTMDTLAQMVAALDDLHPAAKLSLLRDAAQQLRQQGKPDPEIIDTLRPLATSLLQPVHGDRVPDLVTAVLEHPSGEPLGRSPMQTVQTHGETLMSDSTSQYLVAAAQDTLLSDGCTMTEGTLDGQPGVLEVFGDMYTTGELDEFVPIIDPMQWPDCPTSGLFFRRMTPVPEAGTGGLGGSDPHTPPMRLLGDPDAGYSRPVVETVDFSLGIGWDPWVMNTQLDLCFWDNRVPNPGCKSSVGATYALPGWIRDNPQPDNPIVFDRGYLLAEKIMGALPGGPLEEMIHIRTLKQVRFTQHKPLLPLVCAVWRFASAALWATCRHPT
jgi:hypothetical protein